MPTSKLQIASTGLAWLAPTILICTIIIIAQKCFIWKSILWDLPSSLHLLHLSWPVNFDRAIAPVPISSAPILGNCHSQLLQVNWFDFVTSKIVFRYYRVLLCVFLGNIMHTCLLFRTVSCKVIPHPIHFSTTRSEIRHQVGGNPDFFNQQLTQLPRRPSLN